MLVHESRSVFGVEASLVLDGEHQRTAVQLCGLHLAFLLFCVVHGRGVFEGRIRIVNGLLHQN